MSLTLYNSIPPHDPNPKPTLDEIQDGFVYNRQQFRFALGLGFTGAKKQFKKRRLVPAPQYQRFGMQWYLGADIKALAKRLQAGMAGTK